MPLLHPVLLAPVAVIVFLRAADIGYTRYQEATGILDSRWACRWSHLPALRTGRTTAREACSRSASPPFLGLGGGRASYISPWRLVLNSIAPKSVACAPIAVIVPVTSVVVFCAAVSSAWILRRCGVRMPKQGGLRWEPRRTARYGARHRDGGRRRSFLSGLAMALMGLATALLMPLMERYLY